MGTTIQRNLGPVSHLSKREYTVETASGDPAICCPRCGETNDLDMTTHRVLKGGLVSPVWSCPNQACPEVMFLQLEAWGEEVLR